eukprot:m.177274 g.177274  ORF g.177274 m.177274 type:complete len:148 (+) comp15453_c0_seq10:5073-5516(+)
MLFLYWAFLAAAATDVSGEIKVLNGTLKVTNQSAFQPHYRRKNSTLNASSWHYGDPNVGGCLSDEKDVAVDGIPGSFCSPGCSYGPCPTDQPPDSTSTPQCAISSGGSGQPDQCALVCDVGGPRVCTPTARCQGISGAGGLGICTYT